MQTSNAALFMLYHMTDIGRVDIFQKYNHIKLIIRIEFLRVQNMNIALQLLLNWLIVYNLD